jgi:ATP-dependent RNA helicase DHR2
MSKPKQTNEQAPNGTTDDIVLKQGKKRKRAGPGAKRTAEAPAAIRKGTGKLVKFDDDDNEEDTNVAPKAAERKKHDTGGANVTKELDPSVKEVPDRTYKSRNSQSLSRPEQPDHKSRKLDQPSSRKSGAEPKFNQGDRVPQHLLRKRDVLLPIRKSLPIWPQADAIRASLKKNNVLVLTGETGSGKSTQVPQFLANEPWCSKCIAITQPRRVAAISLARRVAEEMGTFMGSQSPTAKVGYSVRFDNATGPGTKIKFLTEGMLLQEMLRDSAMSQYSAIVVDEVHERSVNVDLILGFLKNLVADMESGGSKRKDPLKVVIMSATADVDSLVNFFGSSPAPISAATSTENSRQVSTCFVEGRQYPVKTVYLPEPTQDWVEAALKIIFQIHYKEPLPGDILVFLTGQDTIEGLEKLVNDYAEGMEKDVPKVDHYTASSHINADLFGSCLLCHSSPPCHNMRNNASSNRHHSVLGKLFWQQILPKLPSPFLV